MTKTQIDELYWAFEKVASAIDKCHLHKPQRKKVDEAVSNFRQTFIRLSDKSKTKK